LEDQQRSVENESGKECQWTECRRQVPQSRPSRIGEERNECRNELREAELARGMRRGGGRGRERRRMNGERQKVQCPFELSRRRRRARRVPFSLYLRGGARDRVSRELAGTGGPVGKYTRPPRQLIPPGARPPRTPGRRGTFQTVLEGSAARGCFGFGDSLGGGRSLIAGERGDVAPNVREGAGGEFWKRSS
jgi:hypothetical protein